MDWAEYLLNNDRLIKILCDIFTSFGTVGAVIVSLYLSYRGNHPQPKIRAVADFKYYHEDGDPIGTDGIPVISVDMANLSIVPIEINIFGWVLGFSRRFFRKKVAYQLSSEMIPQISPRLPTVIPYGQNAQYFVPEAAFLSMVRKSFPVSKRFKCINYLKSYFSYLFIQDSIGNHYYFRVTKNLRKQILEEIISSKK